MSKLNLLFTEDGLTYQISKNKTVLEAQSFHADEETSKDFISKKLDEILSKESINQINVISALNHFTLMPESFSQHELGYDLIGYNADVNKETEELMLSVNRRFGVQFYYTFPKEYYAKIKALNYPTNFNFSGEKFLNSINEKTGKEIHINLYHNQCEFWALNNRKLVLYNNLDINSEVDFLYFVMFTLNKIGFGIGETNFYVYGETVENDTFISELKKFVSNLKVVFQNKPESHFLL